MRFKSQIYSRREFLRSGLLLTAAAGTAPSFLARTCLAVEDSAELSSLPGVPDDHILVVIQLSGGNDGLNTIIPYADDAYYRYRPTLALAQNERIRLDDRLAVHRALQPLQSVFDEGELTWVQGVGYPNPNRSHFRSMEIWQTASDAREVLRAGWIGRFFDNTCQGAQPPSAVTIGREMPQALQTQDGHLMGIALSRAEHFAWANPGLTTTHQRRQRELMDFLNQSFPEPADDTINYLQRTALQAIESSDVIAAADRSYRSNVDYPNTRFGHDLQLISKLIAGGVRGRVFYASIGGFDTHANQAGMHTRLLTQVAEGLAAFRRDLIRQRQWDRVAVLGFSEFGRRVDENGSQGTDHGAAAPMFVMGKAFRGGLIGEHPSLDDLGASDLKYAIDFRSVYASVLEHWLGAPHEQVLGRSFPLLDLLRSPG